MVRQNTGDSIEHESAAAIPGLAALPMQEFFTGDFLYLAVVFFILALIAMVIGARGVAGVSMEIARILVVIFIILAVISLLL